MNVLRSPDSGFEKLPSYPLAPHYFEVALHPSVIQGGSRCFSHRWRTKYCRRHAEHTVIGDTCGDPVLECGRARSEVAPPRAKESTPNATGRIVAGVPASLAELELELGRERRSAEAKPVAHADSTSAGPKVLDEKKAALAQRMHVSREVARTIAATLGVSRATGYRVLAKQADTNDTFP
jgi:hypothetical protein